MPYLDPLKQKAYQNEWMQRRRREWLDANGPCARCGSRKDLQVDHKDPAQKTTHRIWSWSAARRQEELTKCQVLCGVCHQEKTYRQIYAEKPGPWLGYACRCAVCRCKRAIRKKLFRRHFLSFEMGTKRCQNPARGEEPRARNRPRMRPRMAKKPSKMALIHGVRGNHGKS